MANRFNIVKAQYWGLKYFTDIQFKALGYRTCGKSATEVDDGYEAEKNSDGIITGFKHKSHTEKYAYYRRHEEYPTNILLGLVALILGIIRIIRRLVVVALPVTLGILIFGFEKPIIYAIEAFFLSWLITIICMVLAITLRKVFRMDERIDEICVNSGWQRYSEYRDE